MLGLMAKLIFWDFESGEIKEVDKKFEDYFKDLEDYDVDEGFEFYDSVTRDSFNVSTCILSLCFFNFVSY